MARKAARRIHRAAPHAALIALSALLLAACTTDAPVPSATPQPEPTPAPIRTPAPVSAAAGEAHTSSAAPDAMSAVTGPIVVLDPGHGGDDIGAAAHGVIEKESNLDMAFRVEALLDEAGVHVVLTRREDTRLAGMELSGFPRSRADRQARVDLANETQADAFVSIHSNGIGNASVRGLETYYNSERSFAEQNYALASAVHEGVLAEVAAVGHALVDRRVRDDTCIYIHRDICRPMFLLGPARTGGAIGPSGMISRPTRATQMPGTLVELLFVTNAADARLLQDEAVRQAMARGIARGVLAFLQQQGSWEPAAED